MTKEQSKAHWWIVENHPDFEIEPPKKYLEICDIVFNALKQGQLLPIDSVSVSLPTDEQITNWVCDEFKIDGLDFDEDVNTQNGYLPEHFKSFAKWILSNER